MILTAVSEALPGTPITNHELAERFGLHEQWLDRMTGNKTRYFCDLDSPEGVPKLTSDMAVAAGAQALAAANVAPEALDFLILSTASPDHLMPATVNLVADRLGINGIPTLQLTTGCAGALQGLFVAQALLGTGSRVGLVIGADSCLKLWPSKDEVKGMKPAELVNFALFGDGAGAAVTSADTTAPGLLVDHLFVRTIGQGRPPGQIVRWFGRGGAPLITLPNGTSAREPMGEEDYKAIEKYVPEIANAILNELSVATGWRVSDVEHVLTPQLNGVMSEKIREHLSIKPERAVSCVAETGNNGNALPFIQLNRLMKRIDAGIGVGGKVFVSTVESSKWIMAGMAMRHQAA